MFERPSGSLLLSIKKLACPLRSDCFSATCITWRLCTNRNTGWFGTDVAFILDSLTFVLSALLIVGVRLPKRPEREKSKLTVGKALGITDTLEGVQYVKGRPRVLAMLLVKPAWGLGGGILTLLAVFGARIFPVGDSPATGIGA